ncbi:MAG: S41 family peptidase [Candidatus Jacksonbacteria bacterium]|nr:S41 family peptidase [Candidatus Jacksonbacteria bacterium]
MKRFSSIYILVFCGAVFFFVFGALVGALFPKAASVLPSKNLGAGAVSCVTIPSFAGVDSSQFALFFEVWESLENRFYKQPVSDEDLFYGAIKGMAASVRDPYTIFLDPKEAAEFNKELEGKFEGIGAEIAIKHDRLTIVSPLADSPAERAGLKPGNIILAIDSLNTAFMSLDEAVTRIRGPKGTMVLLTILSDDSDGTKEVSVKREEITVKTVQVEMVSEDNIAHIRVFSFNEDTMRDFKQAVSSILKRKTSGIILDLRSNPGGYLDSAVEMASYWIPEGVIVEERFSDGAKDAYNAVPPSRLQDIKTVVLVNEGSASASEIVAGALKDYGKAVIVGEQTFGKGSVQDYSPLKDGSALKFTIAQWFTPKGISINDKGITPDVVVPMDAKDVNNNEDPQLTRAIELLQ